MWHSKELQNFESSFIQVNKDSEFYDVLRELEYLKHYSPVWTGIRRHFCSSLSRPLPDLPPTTRDCYVTYVGQNQRKPSCYDDSQPWSWKDSLMSLAFKKIAYTLQLDQEFRTAIYIFLGNFAVFLSNFKIPIIIWPWKQ